MWRYFFDDFSDALEFSQNNVERSNFELFGLGSEFWAAIAGAVIGGALTGAISYLLQRQALRHDEKQREGDRLEKRRALAHSLMLKMNHLVTNFYRIWQVLSTAKKDMNAHALEAWQRFQPLANVPEKIYFSSEELGLVFSLRNNDVFNSILELDRLHNGMVDVLHTLNASQRRLVEQLPPPAEYSGLRGFGSIPADVFKALKPRMLDVNSLFDGEYEIWNSRHIISYKAMQKLVALFNEKLDLKQEITTDVAELAEDRETTSK